MSNELVKTSFSSTITELSVNGRALAISTVYLYTYRTIYDHLDKFEFVETVVNSFVEVLDLKVQDSLK